MTVAAFLAVAASSYAAVTVGNNGYKSTIKKDATATSIEVVLKKGTYAITSTVGTVSVTSPDGKTTYADADAVVIGDAGATVKITATLDAKADKDTETVFKIEPKGEDWVAKKQAIQNQINQLVTEAAALPDDATDVNFAKRKKMLDDASVLQKSIDAMGIEEYNTWIGNGGKLDSAIPSIENQLTALQKSVSNATANKKAYDKALAAYDAVKTGDLAALEGEYNAIKDDPNVEKATKDAAKALVDQNKANVEQLKKDADAAYADGTAAVLFSDDKIADKVGKKDSAADKNDGTGLVGGIEDASKSIESGSTENVNYALVKARVEGALGHYNFVANKLYELLEAEGIPAGYGKDIYDDIYKASIEELKPILATINDVDEKNEADHAAGKATDTRAKLATVNDDLDGVYAAVEARVGVADVDAVVAGDGTLRGTYKAAQTTIDGYTASLDDFKDAAKDKDIDKDKKVIGDYFTGKVNTLKGQIKAIQDKLDAANAGHFVDGFDLDALANAKDGYTATRAAAGADLAEWTAYTDSKAKIDAVEKELTDPKTGANAAVAKMKSEDGKFVAADRFSTKGITDAIATLRDKTRANYAVTATDKKIAENFKPTVIAGVTTGAEKDQFKGTTAISAAIGEFQTTAQTAFDNYNTITAAIADFTASIEGKQAVGEDGKPKWIDEKNKIPEWVTTPNYKPWDEVVLNPKVTLSGAVDGSSLTYADAKKAEEDKVAVAEKAVADALAIDKAKEADFSKALATAAGKEGEVNTSKTLIIQYKDNYTDVLVDTWEANTADQAQKDAIEESTARMTALADEIDLINQVKPKEGDAKPDGTLDPYAAEDYGTAAAQKLTDRKAELYASLTDATRTDEGKESVAALINKAAAEDDASVAIALIKNTVQPMLDKIENGDPKDAKVDNLKKLQEDAVAWKASFGEFKRTYDEVDELLNGVPARDKDNNFVYDKVTGKQVYQKKGVKQLLDPAPENFLDDEILEQNNALAGLWTDVNAAVDVAAARKDVLKDGKVETQGLDSKLAAVKNAVDNKKSGLESGLRQKAENESANVTAWNTWQGKIDKYETVDKKDKSVDDIYKETQAAIKKSQPEGAKDTPGEEFFLAKLEGLNDQLINPDPEEGLYAEAEVQFNQKIKDDKKNDTKYTDPKFNLANGDLEDYYLDELATIVDDMKGLVALSAANETAFEAQHKAYEEAKTAYEELLVEVNKAKDSQGDAYAATYEAAMTKLTEINSELKRYRNGYDTVDKKGNPVHENGYKETADGKKDGAYENGASVKFDGDLKKINAIKTAIKTLSDTWNAGEDEEGSYKKAVADDNAARKTAFDNAFSKLYKTYYGEVKDAKKVEGAVDVVTKLSKLHYADQVTDDVKNIVTGTSDECLYTYAEKITKLQNDAQKAFDAVEAPAFFDEGETWKAQAEAMATKISGLAQDYADAVNAQAIDDYEDNRDLLDNAITQATEAIVDALDIDAAAALKLANAAPKDQKGAKDILDDAKVQAGELPNADKKLEQVIDFAYQVENTIVPNINKALTQLLPAAMVDAAQNNWKATFGAIDTAKEEAAIAGFYGCGDVANENMKAYKQGYYSWAYSNDDDDEFGPDQVDRLKAIEADWNWELAWYNGEELPIKAVKSAKAAKVVSYIGVDEFQRAIYLLYGYESIKDELDEEIATKKVGEDKDKKPIMETHTNTYWTAKAEDDKYQRLKKGNEALVAAQAALNEKLEAAVAFYNDLLVEHDEELEATVEGIDWSINYDLDADDVTADKQPAVKAIEDRIEALKDRAILKEYEALGVEIGEIDKAFGDKDAALRKTLNTYKETNDGIYSDYTVGKKNADGSPMLDKDNQQIKADQNEVKERFAALEKYVGKTKGEVDEAAKTAAADVAAAVEGLDAKYDALKKQLAETSEYVQVYFEDEIEGLGADIDAIKAKIQKEGDAITIEKDNNLEAIEKVEADIAETSEDIADKQEAFDDQAEFAATYTDKLNELSERLAAVNEAAAAYEHQLEMPETDRWWRLDENGEKVYYTNFREFMYDNFSYTIAETQKAIDALPARTDLDPNYDYRTYWDEYYEIEDVVGWKNWKDEWVSGELEDNIDQLELALAGYDAKGYVDEVNEDLEEVHDQLDDIIDSLEDLDVDTDKWDDLHDEIVGEGGLYAQIDDIEEYAENVFTTGESDVDIEGKYFDEKTKEAKEIDFVTEAYPTIVAKAVELKQAVADIAAQIVTPGAITNGTTVEGGDIALISNLILGISTPEELAEEGYAVSAADVDGDGEYTVADLTLTQNMYLYGSYEGWTEEFIAKAKAREASKPVYYGVGTLGMDIATSEIAVSLEKGRSYAAIQLDVTLPAGVELADAAFAGNNDAVSVAYNKLGDNTWRLLISANDNSSVNADEALVALSIAGEGAGKVAIDNAIGATAKGKSVKLAGISGDYTIATGIAATETKVAEGEGTIFGANGAIRKQLEKGVNIIKTAGGAVKKIFVK